jgi:hypothetical protein
MHRILSYFVLWLMICFNVMGAETSSPAILSQDQIKQLRHEAAKRQRRIIFDNDGNEVVYYMDEATPEALRDQ